MATPHNLFPLFSGPRVTRDLLGLPLDWATISSWLDPTIGADIPPPLAQAPLKKKCPEIPALPNYRSRPPNSFWSTFPSQSLPEGISTQINIKVLKAKVANMTGRWTSHQKERAARAIKDLSQGASAFQGPPLPSTVVPNAESAYINGEAITDALGAWIKSKIILGPFDQPPVKDFRVNCIMAVVQKDKVRPVLDMSRPKDRSFNSNIEIHKLDHVTMSTARQFSYTLREAGKGAIMTKLDMKDAYKLVPCQKEDWRLQGMSWLGKYFIEPQMIFGATSAVANYDAQSRTANDLAVAECEIPTRWTHRILDDTTAVSPADSGWTLRFTEAYKSICQELSIPLAAPCPNREKAFENTTSGRVMGIWFDSTTMSWSYPLDKAVPTIRSIHHTMEVGMATLHQMQVIAGELNDVALLCPFLKAFRKPTNEFMSSFEGNEDLELAIPDRVKKDLAIQLKVLVTASIGLPVAVKPSPPPLNQITFTSDAAGAIMAKVGGTLVATSDKFQRGVASVAFTEEGHLWFSCRLFWPDSFLTKSKDSKGSLYGSKSTTLETVGLLLPFFSIPEAIRGRDLVMQVDNLAVYYGWDSKQVKEDTAASILIRALYLISVSLECRIHVRHLPRLSSEAGELADHLSREYSTTRSEERWASSVERQPHCPALEAWLTDPVEDWSLVDRILADVASISNPF